MEIKRIIDHHCHGVTTDNLDRAAFEALISESHLPPPDGCSNFDKPASAFCKKELVVAAAFIAPLSKDLCSPPERSFLSKPSIVYLNDDVYVI